MPLIFVWIVRKNTFRSQTNTHYLHIQFYIEAFHAYEINDNRFIVSWLWNFTHFARFDETNSPNRIAENRYRFEWYQTKEKTWDLRGFEEKQGRRESERRRRRKKIAIADNDFAFQIRNAYQLGYCWTTKYFENRFIPCTHTHIRTLHVNRVQLAFLHHMGYFFSSLARGFSISWENSHFSLFSLHSLVFTIPILPLSTKHLIQLLWMLWKWRFVHSASMSHAI